MIIAILTDWFRRSNKSERLWLLAKIEFKLRYYENKLGLFWALIKPLMDIAIYYVVFQLIMEQGIPAFASYLFIGLIIWNFFLESTTGTVQILNTKKYLYEYSNMNKLEIYVSTLLSNSIGFFFNFIMFLIFFNFMEKGTAHSNFQTLWIVPLFVNLYILSLATSLIISNIYVIAKDITQVWQVFTQVLFFLSPILYNLDKFKTALPWFDYLNPLAGIIINARKTTMLGTSPDFKLFLFDFMYAIILLIFGTFLLNKLGSKAAEKL
jgi:ABC-type polysaccharide/polyol phosphate export permease